VPPHEPEAGEAARQAEAQVLVEALAGQDGPQVGVLGLEAVEPGGLVGPGEGHVADLGEAVVPTGVGGHGLGLLPLGGELLDGELADRLEHRHAPVVALAGQADEALVGEPDGQRDDGVGGDARQRGERRHRRPAGEGP
jgi:hypothetical protein